MPLEFAPILTILAGPQRRLWDELGSVADPFVLCGGTAVALQLGHRSSVDFDFVAREEFDPDELTSRVSFLQGSRQVQKCGSPNECSAADS